MGLSLSSLNPVKQFKEGFESVTGVSDARAGLERANAAQQEAIRKAIATIEGGGTGATTALTDAQKLALASIGQGRQDISSGYSAGIDRLAPISSMFDPTALGKNFTQQGFIDQLTGFTDPTGSFAPLFASRQQAATNALGSAGLTRSNTAAEQAANIDLETALGLSRELYGRQIQNPALQAITQQSQLEAQQGQNLAANSSKRAELEARYGSDIANLILGQASNVANLQTGAGASEAQALQAIGGLRSQAVAPFIEAGIGAATGGMSSMINKAKAGKQIDKLFENNPDLF